VPLDTHEKLPILDLSESDLKPHLRVFEELSSVIPVVMMAHMVVPGLGDMDQPASLSRTVVDRATRLPGAPVVLSDDLEMGALDDWGDIADRVEAALRARNHGILICKAFDRLDDIARHLTELSATDSTLGTRLLEMATRMGTLRRDLCQRAAAVPAPDDATVIQLWERARREAG
jgi:beta-glucosidase-like glycosyl hydrolase